MSPAWASRSDSEDLALHAAARRILAARGETMLARGAANITTITAYQLAATPSGDPHAFGIKVRRLWGFLSGVEPERRAYVAALTDAALAIDAEARAVAHLVPHDLRPSGWMDMVRPGVAGMGDDDVLVPVALTPDVILR